MPNLDAQTLNILAQRGVQYCIPVVSEFGQITYIAGPEDLLVFADDPDAIYSKAHGVTKAEYRDWTDDGFTAMCAATTKTGRRCRNDVLGGHLVSAKRWVELQGGYCAVHGDGSN